jgi:hypothetical protein
MKKGQKMFGDGGVKFFCVASELSCPRSVRGWKFRGVKKCKDCEWKRSFSDLSTEQKKKVKKDGKILWWGSFVINPERICTKDIRFKEGETGYDDYMFLYKHCYDIRRLVSHYLREVVEKHITEKGID